MSSASGIRLFHTHEKCPLAPGGRVSLLRGPTRGSGGGGGCEALELLVHVNSLLPFITGPAIA